MHFGNHLSEDSNVGGEFLGKPFVTSKCYVFKVRVNRRFSFGECVAIAHYPSF